LRRSSIKSWLLESKEKVDEPDVLQKVFTTNDRTLFADAQISVTEVDVLKHTEKFGMDFKSGREQVVVHGRNDVRNFGEIAFVIRNKRNKKLVLLLHELDVDYEPRLGLHICRRSGRTTLIKFSDLISAVPLNMYTSADHQKNDISYVSLKEALIV
jgi:hypothetical protein